LKLLNALVSTMIPIVFTVVGVLIITKQSHNVIGWIVMIPPIFLALSDPLTSAIENTTVPPTEPSFSLLFALWFASTGWVLLIFPLFFIALLFPTGSPLSPRWRWVVVYALGMVVFFYALATFVQTLSPNTDANGGNWSVRNPIGFIPQATMDAIFSIWWSLALMLLVVLCVVSLVMRFRRAGGVEKHQIKWLLYACCLFALLYLPLVVTQGNWEGVWAQIGDLLLNVGVIGFPIAIGIAILRYRLYDIDIIIRRTLVYGALTVLLALVYFGSVVLLQQLFRVATGQSSEIAIIISTLAIAALFVPLRRRVQEAFDRRFYRRRYDAAKVLAAFGAAARDEVELEKLTDRLLAVVEETMQPAQVSLWMRKTEGRAK
jgi:hypothetical protein